MGGPSAEAKANEAAQTAFYKQMTEQQSQVFSENQDLLKQIQDAQLPLIKAVGAATEEALQTVSPTIAAGPNQYGFSPDEEKTLETSVTDAGARATANAIAAQKLRDTQRSMGGNILPSGASEQEELIANELGEQQTATNLSNVKLQGFNVGRQNYAQALQALEGISGQSGSATGQLLSSTAPTPYSSAATGAGSSATDAINLTDSERSNLLSSILGGVVSGGLNLATGGLKSSGAFGR